MANEGSVKVKMDMSEVQAQTKVFVDSLNQQSDATVQLFKDMAEVNKQGDAIKRTVSGINEEGRTFEATLRKMSDGWEVVRVKTQQATEAFKKAREAQESAKASAETGKVNSATGEQALFSAFQPTSLNFSQANSVDTAIQRIKSSLADGKVSIERFQELLAQFQANPRGIFPGLNEEEARIVKSFRTIQGALDASADAKNQEVDKWFAATQRKIAAQEKEAAAIEKAKSGAAASLQGEAFLRGQFDFSKIRPEALSSIEGALGRIKGLLDSGKISFERFKEIFEQIKANPNQLLPNLTAEEQAAQKAIRTLVEGFGDKVPKAVKGSESLFISLTGILRLLEAQILKRIFSSIENELLGSVQAAQQFSVQIAEIRTVSQDAQLTTEKWANSINDLSGRYGKSQADVAEGVYQSISNQVAQGADSFKFMETALRFANASASSATDSVNLLSGALKSFQLPASDAERVSAILFRTIELGRVRAKDMADTFGRVGTIARDAGVSLEEVSASIAVLTNRGIKFADASTLIQNLILKLVRPTDEMKELFKQWGVASGDAAIATFGFSGVLQKLDAEAGKGTGRLGDLLGQIRAIRATVGLTGGAFSDYQDYLKKVSSGESRFDKAEGEVSGSLGQRSLKQLQELRNFFEQDFGRPFLRGLLDLSDAAGGLVNIVKALVAVTITATAAYIAYTAITTTVIIEQSLEVAAKAANVTVTQLLTMKTWELISASGTFIATWGPFIAAFAAGWLIGNQIMSQWEDKVDSIIAKAKEATEAQEKLRANIRKQEDAADASKTKKVADQYDATFKTILQYTAAVTKANNELKEKVVANYKTTTEALKITANTYFDSIRQKMKALNEAASESKRLIKGSLKESEDLQRRGSQKIFDEKLKYSSEGRQDPLSGFIIGDQKVELLKNRIRELAEKAREEFGKGTAESIGEGRKLFNDVEKLQQQLFEVETAKQKRTFDFQAQKGLINPTGYDSAGKPYYEFVVKTAEMERQINKTTEERIELEETFRQVQLKRQQAAEQEAERERERLRALQQQFTLLEKIEVFNKEGKLKTEYSGPGGLAKLVGEFDERRSKILELSAGDPQEQFKVFRDLGAQRAALIQQVMQAMREEGLSQIASGAKRDNDSARRLATDNQAKVKDFRVDIERLMGGLNREIGIFEEKVLDARAPWSVGGRLFEDSGDYKKRTAAEPSRQEAIDALERVKAARDAFNADGGRTSENAATLKKAIDDVNTATREYIRLRGLDKDAELGKAGTLGDQIVFLQGVGRQVADIGTGIEGADAKIKGARQTSADLLEKFQKMPEAVDAMRQAAIEAAPVTQATFQTLERAASDYASQLERINAAIRENNALLPAVPRGAGADAEGKMFGGMMNYYSGGGFVPRGSDQIPAMLSRGEMVINPAATAAFAPLLTAMNNGLIPRNSGQSNTTNVGDVTVNITGGQTNRGDIRNIGMELRRAIKRGTVDLT